jgi:GNAT superfamily N-acetyltransferase
MAEGAERVRVEGDLEVLVRPLVAEDRELLREAFDRLGEESRYRRFLAPKRTLSTSELTYLTDVDHVDHEAIAALDAATGEGVGVARYIRLPDRPEVAEAAVTVVDEWQGRGVGHLLLDRLVARAEANGIERFRASMLVSNRVMRHLLEQIGDLEVIRQGEGSVDVDVELPVERSSLRVALRGAARRLASLSARE